MLWLFVFCAVKFYWQQVSLWFLCDQIWNHNRVLADEFMGMATLSEQGAEERETKDYDLFGKKKKELEMQRPGKVTIEIVTSDDLTAF